MALYYCVEFQPEVIVQVGDLRDWYSHSRFTRKVNLFTPKQEDDWGSFYSELFWKTLNDKCEKAEKYQLLGNHCIRPMARIMEKAPEFEEDLVEKVHERFTFDGVKTIYDPREELDVGGVRFIHGYKSQLGDHAKFNHMSVVCGHTHRGGMVSIPLFDRNIFELNVGYLADPTHPALSYTMQKKATNWTLGFGLIDQDGPRFISLDNIYLSQVADSAAIKPYLF